MRVSDGGLSVTLQSFSNPSTSRLLRQVSLHLAGSTWQNQILQRDWQSHRHAHGGRRKPPPPHTSFTFASLIKCLNVSFFISCQLFSDVAYKARDREDLIAGVDEFLDEVIVLPPGEWDPKIRIEPPKKVPSAEMRRVHHGYLCGA